MSDSRTIINRPAFSAPREHSADPPSVQVKDATAGGQGAGVQAAQWVAAILFNGLGRYEQALAAARQASEGTPHIALSDWALTELIEASTRTGEDRLATDALDRVA